MAARALYFPSAVVKLVSYRGEAPLFSGRPLGWLMHVQAGNNSPFGWFSGLVKPDRAFCHLWIAKGGGCEQYQGADRQAWAAQGGNERYWQVEFEGYPSEALTAEQLATARRWHIWTGTANKLANAPGEAGIGRHSMGPGGWGHPLCPGGLRAGQRSLILTPAKPAARSRILRLTVPLMNGLDVRAVQVRVGELEDGYYGRRTRSAVMVVQRRHWPRWAAQWDGVVGPATARALGLVWVR